MADIHLCEVCGRDGHGHDQRPFGETYFFLSPCCKGCGCGSWEDAFATIPAKEREAFVALYAGIGVQL